MPGLLPGTNEFTERSVRWRRLLERCAVSVPLPSISSYPAQLPDRLAVTERVTGAIARPPQTSLGLATSNRVGSVALSR